MPLRCAACGYPKAGVKGAACPECGCDRVVMQGGLLKQLQLRLLLIPAGVLASPGIWFLGALHWLEHSGTTDAQSGLVVLGPMFSVPFALLAGVVLVSCVVRYAKAPWRRNLLWYANLFGMTWIGFFIFLAVEQARSPGW